jgi:hypothetical protein
MRLGILVGLSITFIGFHSLVQKALRIYRVEEATKFKNILDAELYISLFYFFKYFLMQAI